MRHSPTTEELEHAVADVLQQSPDRELSAKEVRDKLVKEKGGWKVPAERRIAKFVKRQNSRKASASSRNGLLGKFFKGGKKSPPIIQETQQRNDNNNSEEDPSLSRSERERKGGLRSSFAKVFSPGSSRNRKTGGTPESIQTSNFKTGGGGGAEDISVVTTETAVAGETPTATAATATSNDPTRESSPPLDTGTSADDKKAEEIAPGEGNGDADKFKVQTAEKNSDFGQVTKEVFMEAYVDDNDGTTKDCACGACIVM